MARHWSVFCGGVTEKQAMALDRMARNHGLGDGMGLLMELTGKSRSYIGRMDRASLRPYLDEAFERYREPPAAPIADPLTEAVEAGLARINAEGSATADPRAEALAQVRRLMAEHGLTVEDLSGGPP